MRLPKDTVPQWLLSQCISKPLTVTGSHRTSTCFPFTLFEKLPDIAPIYEINRVLWRKLRFAPIYVRFGANYGHFNKHLKHIHIQLYAILTLLQSKIILSYPVVFPAPDHPSDGDIIIPLPCS